MKFIKRKSALKPITGSIVDTFNVNDKTKNTYSANVIDELVKEVYSTEEKVIGTFLEKPLYERTFDLGLIGDSNAISKYAIGENIKFLVDCRGRMVNYLGISSMIPLKFESYTAELFAESSEGKILVTFERNQAGPWSDRNLVVTTKYTKTTD